MTFDPDAGDNTEIVRMETMNPQSCLELPGVASVTPDLSGYSGTAWLLETDDAIAYEQAPDPHDPAPTTRFFVVSGVHVKYTGWQCLVFPATEDGEPLSYQHLAGGDGYSHRAAIEELIERYF